jgi:hypothetical protein
MLYKLKFYLPSRILKSIYHAFIHGNIQYLLIVWGAAHKASLKPIQILQNKSKKGPLFGTFELYHTVVKGILLVRALYEYQVSCFVFKVEKSNLIFGRLTHLHPNRARVENQLGSIGAKTDYGKRRIAFSGPTIFNSLDCNRKFATWKIGDVG